MRKPLIIAALILASLPAAAQDFAYKIPRTAAAVATLNTDQLFNLLSVSEFDRSFAGMKLLKSLSEKQERPYKSIRDLGISLSAPMYYYYRQTDSISYHCVLLPLANAQKLERFLAGAKTGGRIERRDGLNTLHLSPHDKTVLMWNEELALIITPQLKNNFFKDPQAAARYEMLNEEDAVVAEYSGPQAVDTAMMADIMESEVIEPMPARKKGQKTATVRKKKTTQKFSPPVIREEEGVVEEAAMPITYPWQRKDSLAGAWANEYAQRVFSKAEDASSILDNEGYQRSTDKNAVGALYVANVQRIYGGFLESFYPKRMGSLVQGYGSMNAKLYLDRNEARMTSELELDGVHADDWRRVYDHRINPAFLNYINTDRVVGFMGYSFDTKSYLELFPKMMEQTYGGFLGLDGNKYNQELSLGADLVSLLLDEEAVAQVVKGDALLLFNGVSTKKVTYKSYEYNNDNYESKEVTRTKMESLPDFLLMISSDDTRLICKLLKYGVDKDQMTEQDGIYSVREGALKTPLATHFMIKDGIIFIGTSRSDLYEIRNGSYEAHIGKAQKKLLMDNNLSMYFNPANLRDKIPQKTFGSMKTWNQFNTFLGSTGPMYARSGINGNHFTGEVVAEIPEGHENALKYFFSLIDDIASMD